MTLMTSNGTVFEVDFAALSSATGKLHIRLDDSRSLARIAADFDGELRFDADRRLDGPFTLTSIIRDDRTGRVSMTLRKE